MWEKLPADGSWSPRSEWQKRLELEDLHPGVFGNAVAAADVSEASKIRNVVHYRRRLCEGVLENAVPLAESLIDGTASPNMLPDYYTPGGWWSVLTIGLIAAMVAREPRWVAIRHRLTPPPRLGYVHRSDLIPVLIEAVRGSWELVSIDTPAQVAEAVEFPPGDLCTEPLYKAAARNMIVWDRAMGHFDWHFESLREPPNLNGRTIFW